MASTTSPFDGGPRLLVRDSASIGGIDGGSSIFEVTNRGTHPVRLTAIAVHRADAGEDASADSAGRYGVQVDDRRSALTAAGTEGGATLSFDEPVSVAAGETATVRLFDHAGSAADDRDCGVVVTLHTEHDGRGHETTVHLAG